MVPISIKARYPLKTQGIPSFLRLLAIAYCLFSAPAAAVVVIAVVTAAAVEAAEEQDDDYEPPVVVLAVVLTAASAAVEAAEQQDDYYPPPVVAAAVRYSVTHDFNILLDGLLMRPYRTAHDILRFGRGKCEGGVDVRH